MHMKMLYIKHRSGKRMNNFAISAILAAKELGIDFTLASNMSMAEPGHFEKVCEQYGIKMIHIDFDRNPLGKSNLLARKQLIELMKKENYDIVHCNTPSGGMVGRIAAAQAKIPKVLYMAHGFHFWKGAPLKNWLLYYPVERFLAHFTDRLITINREDYICAQRFRFKKGGRAEYVPGVGIDIEKVKNCPCEREKKREELGLDSTARIFITVAELIPRKGYESLIRAFAQAEISNSILLICGIGVQEKYLKDLVHELHMDERIRFLGFRTDVYELLKASDAFVFASKQEGLPVALMEAMAADLPCVTSKIRGNADLMRCSELTFDVGDTDGLSVALKKATDDKAVKSEVKRNAATLKQFSLEEAVSAMKAIYTDISRELNGSKM